MQKILFLVSFLVLFCTSVFSQITSPKVGEVIGQMGQTWNEEEGGWWGRGWQAIKICRTSKEMFTAGRSPEKNAQKTAQNHRNTPAQTLTTLSPWGRGACAGDFNSPPGRSVLKE